MVGDGGDSDPVTTVPGKWTRRESDGGGVGRELEREGGNSCRVPGNNIDGDDK